MTVQKSDPNLWQDLYIKYFQVSAEFSLSEELLKRVLLDLKKSQFSITSLPQFGFKCNLNTEVVITDVAI